MENAVSCLQVNFLALKPGYFFSAFSAIAFALLADIYCDSSTVCLSGCIVGMGERFIDVFLAYPHASSSKICTMDQSLLYELTEAPCPLGHVDRTSDFLSGSRYSVISDWRIPSTHVFDTAETGSSLN